jgi:hypothetical protein
LASKDFNLSHITPLLSGWGSLGLDEGAVYPSKLQTTSDLLILSDDECREKQKQYLNFVRNGSSLSGKYRGVLERGICAKGKTSKVEAGYGDSGGPLVAMIWTEDIKHKAEESDDINNNKSARILKPVKQDPRLIGVVSHMRPDTDPVTNATFHLDYFVRVSDFTRWILMSIVPVPAHSSK